MVMTGAWFMTLFYPHYSKSHGGFSGCEVLLWLGIRSQSSGTGGLWVACLSMSTWITKFSSIIQARLENISFSDLFRYSVALKMPRDSRRSTGVCHEVSAGAPSDFRGVFLLSLVCSKADPLGLALPVHCHSRMDSGGLWLRLPMHRSIGRPVETCWNMLKQWEFHDGSMMCTPKSLCKQQRNIIISRHQSEPIKSRWVGPPRPGSLLPKSSGPAESCPRRWMSLVPGVDPAADPWSQAPRDENHRQEISWAFRPSLRFSLGFLKRIFHLDHLDNSQISQCRDPGKWITKCNQPF